MTVTDSLRSYKIGTLTMSYRYNYKNISLQTLEKRFLDLETVNEYNNERAVEQAVWVYSMKMGKISEPPVSVWTAIVRVLVAANEKWKPGEHHHDECKRDAVQVFKKRRRGAEYPDDKYYNDLIKVRVLHKQAEFFK